MEKNRLIFLVKSVLTLLLLGTVYSWSVFRVYVELDFEINASLSGLPYMVSLVSYSIAMLYAGKNMFIHRKNLVIVGAFLFISGFVFASTATNIWTLTLFYGLFLGTGVGLIYGVPLYLINQTFPKRVGFYSGIVLLGFGFSSVIMAPMVKLLLDAFGLSQTFILLAILSIIILIITLGPLTKKYDINKPQIQKNPYNKKNFTTLYFIFLLSLISGLMIIGLTYRIGVLTYQFNETFVTISISIFAIGNGLSRPLFGWFVDRFGFFKSSLLSLSLLIVSGFLSIFNGGTQTVVFAVSYFLFWFCLGSWTAMAPLAIKSLFGKDMYAQLYGRLFTAYGVAAIIGTLFSGFILDFFQSAIAIYLLIIIANFINVFLVLLLKKNTAKDFSIS
jgi:MFS transporter, OFA family, oxalate/formate antiporter